jgi:hypothetical protein
VMNSNLGGAPERFLVNSKEVTVAAQMRPAKIGRCHSFGSDGKQHVWRFATSQLVCNIPGIWICLEC